MTVWSFSGSRLFHKCPRQWYFRYRFANAIAKDKMRHEAYLLSKLQTISAWRGSVVDQVIQKCYALPLANGGSPSRSDTLNYARTIFNQQVRFARANRVREAGMTVKKGGANFAAFFDVEYGDGVAQKDIQTAWHDTETALINLLEMTDLQSRLCQASHLVTQRALTFTYDGIRAKMTPDLVAFFDDGPPLIIDWKVHTFGTHSYRLQLALYALALTNCEAHSDFPKSNLTYAPTDLHLTEVQLLKAQQRHYQLTDMDIEAVSNYIAQTAYSMELSSAKFEGDMLLSDIPTTNDSDECVRCPFRSLCWNQG